MLVLEAIVRKKKLDLTKGKGEAMGLLGIVWSTHERGEKGIFGLLGKRVTCHARDSVSIHLDGTN
jgi:hypothetical protein